MSVDCVVASAFCLWPDRIYNDLRRAGIEMLLNAIADLRFCAPRNERVDESVAAAVFQIG